MPPKLLVTGATGFLGSHLVGAARKLWHPVGTYHGAPRVRAQRFFGRMDYGRIDLGDYGETKAMLAEVAPAAVIHAAAITDLDFCEQFAYDSLRINMQASVDLAALCGDVDVPFVFTSTDFVFDGTDAPYAEGDPPAPVNIFGEHRALAEEGILSANEDALVCRLPLLIGYSLFGRETAFYRMAAAFRAGNGVTLHGDAIRTPLGAREAADALLRFAGSGFEEDVNVAQIDRVTGLLHLGGRDALSSFELGLLALRILGLDEELAIATSLWDAPSAPSDRGPFDFSRQQGGAFVAARPSDVSLDSGRAHELGFDPPPLRDQVEALLPSAWRAEPPARGDLAQPE